jgi:predicted nucleotidyltransferase
MRKRKAERSVIDDALIEIAETEHVRIVYACEAGSRAWGFASPDSDHDVRFIYHHPLDWYLSVEEFHTDERRDTIERPIENGLDLCGWDLLKTLRLFRKSNPPLLEWLHSPTRYLDSGVADTLRRFAARWWSPRGCAHHYLHMAEGNYRDFLAKPEVPHKKYLYVIRPLLAIRWMEARGSMPPVEIQRLAVMLTDDAVLAALAILIQRKQEGKELGICPRDEILSGFIEGELARHDRYDLMKLEFKERRHIGPRALDRLFRETLAEAGKRGW